MYVNKFLIISSKGSVTVRERKPRLAGNEVCLKFVIDIPNALFERPTLSAVMKIPLEAVPKATITPTIIDNVENLIKQATGLDMAVRLVEHEESKNE